MTRIRSWILKWSNRLSQNFTVASACITDIGNIRSNNEDNFSFAGVSLPLDHTSLSEPLRDVSSTDRPAAFALFDGMGGESAGEIASFVSAESFHKFYNPGETSTDDIKRLLCTINQEVVRTAAEQKYNQIGSTAVVLILNKNKYVIADLGDSPCFLFRDGRLQRLTVPHTNEKYLAMQNIKGRKPALTQFLGISTEEMILEPYAAEERIYPGDVFLICSDGLTDMVPPDDIVKILEEIQEPSEGVQSLLHKALENGGRDNITIMLLAIRKTPAVSKNGDRSQS